MWALVMERLSPGRRVFAYDLRGHGWAAGSPAPFTMADIAADLLGVLDALDLNRAHVVGLSYGGGIVQTAATSNPERFESLALLATSECSAGRHDTPSAPVQALDPWRSRRNPPTLSRSPSTGEPGFALTLRPRVTARVHHQPLKLRPGLAPLGERAEDPLQHRKLLVEHPQLSLHRGDALPLRCDAAGDQVQLCRGQRGGQRQALQRRDGL